MVVDFLETEIIFNKTLTTADPIKFDISRLNEDYVFRARLYSPDGKQIIVRRENVDYDCISFQTVMSYSVTSMTSP